MHTEKTPLPPTIPPQTPASPRCSTYPNTFLNSNPWKFCSIPSIHSKVIHDFLLPRQTNGWMDTQTPYKMNHPTTLYGYGRKFFIPHFFYLSQNRVSLLCLLTPFCLDKQSKILPKGFAKVAKFRQIWSHCKWLLYLVLIVLNQLLKLL